jgi:NADH-quinone oxidoreductase subunit M
MLYILLGILSLGFLCILFLPTAYENYRASLALSSSCIGFVVCMLMYLQFSFSNTQFQYVTYENTPLGLDNISLCFVILTGFLFPLCLVASWGPIQTKSYLLCFLGIEVLCILVFSVLDLIGFYVFFEGVLIPMFFLIGMYGSRARKIRASYFFFIYTLIGSLFLISSIIYIYSVVGTCRYESLSAYNFSFNQEILLWLGFFISFAVKVPMLPFHIWLPEAHVEAPTAGSAILAGVLLKLGIYGFLRFSLPLFPNASIYYSPFIFCLCILGVVYTSLTAIRQTDLKRIIAYTSVAHMNLVVLGIFSNSLIGIHGCIIQSLSHGFVSAALFLCIGVLYDRYHTRYYNHYGGLIHTIPLFGIFFIFFTMANIAIPGTSSFVGEFLLFIGIFSLNPVLCFFGASSIVLSGVYSLWLCNRMVYTNLKTQYLKVFTDLNKCEVFVLGVCAFNTVFFGLFPDYILNLFN